MNVDSICGAKNISIPNFFQYFSPAQYFAGIFDEVAEEKEFFVS